MPESTTSILRCSGNLLEAWGGGGSTRAPYIGITRQLDFPILLPDHWNPASHRGRAGVVWMTRSSRIGGCRRRWNGWRGPCSGRGSWTSSPSRPRPPVPPPAAFPSLPETIFDALPARLVDSELGLLPDGWQVGCLAISRERREAVDLSGIEQTTPYIGLEHMPRRSIALTDWEHAGKVTSGKARFRAGQILFGKLRPYFHKVGIAPLDGVCSTDIVVIEPKTPDWFGLTMAVCSSDAFVAQANACSTGTKMPRTNWQRHVPICRCHFTCADRRRVQREGFSNVQLDRQRDF